MEILDVSPEPEFPVGGAYLRKELHNEFGGQRQSGISTPADQDFIFIFTDTETDEHGYADRFREDDMFIYSGEGRIGDMTMDRGNEQVRDHQKDGEKLFVFENIGEQRGADVVSFVGRYEYVDHYWEQAPDDNGDIRKAVRFVLKPAGGTESEIITAPVDGLSGPELFEKAKQSAKSSAGETSRSASGTRHPRSQLVREFALRMADGICQRCENEAPFRDIDDEKFLEVHHLHRRSDGGVDDPENVIALCPNCHRERHHGKNGDELNERLIEKAEKRNRQFQK